MPGLAVADTLLLVRVLPGGCQGEGPRRIGLPAVYWKMSRKGDLRLSVRHAVPYKPEN
jgi:hypothetical protein